MKSQTRRTFFKTAGLGVAGIAVVPAISKASELAFSTNESSEIEFGIASYGLRKLSVDGVIELMNSLQISKLSVKSMHLPLDSSEDEIKATIKKMKDAGVDPYSAGVVYMKTKEAIDQAFEYAKMAGFKTIIGVPNYELLDYVEEKVKEYDIVVAIHNHGPGGLPYPTGKFTYDKIKDRDERIGLCLDVAHTARTGADPVAEIKAVKDRLYDLHLRDNTENVEAGRPCRPGDGTLDLVNIMKALKRIDYKGVYTIEYEGGDAEAPLAGVALTLGYLKGISACI